MFISVLQHYFVKSFSNPCRIPDCPICGMSYSGYQLLFYPLICWKTFIRLCWWIFQLILYKYIFFFNLQMRYDAPFFTTWFCTNWAVLFFPIYALVRMATGKCESPTDIFAESLRAFRDKGFTAGNIISCLHNVILYWYLRENMLFFLFKFVEDMRILISSKFNSRKGILKA